MCAAHFANLGSSKEFLSRKVGHGFGDPPFSSKTGGFSLIIVITGVVFNNSNIL